MLINKQSLTTVFLGLSTLFHNALNSAPSNWQKVAMRVTSSTSQTDYHWLSQFPRMREWIGEKHVKSLQASTYTIKNKDWEATVEVDRNDIEDDQLGIYGPQAQMAGESARDLPADIVFALANGAFTNLCYDGKAFCATDHPVINPTTGAPANVSNKLTVALSAATQAAAIASLGAAVTAMMTFKDDEGRPLAIVPDTLLVPPALEAIAAVLFTNDRLEDGKPNPYKGRFAPLVEPRLSSSTAWFLLCTTKPVKPFIYQERKAPAFVQQTDVNSDLVFLQKKFRFGAEARANGGYGFWQLAVGSTGAGA